MATHPPIASMRIIVRLEILNKVGMIGKVTSTIGEMGGDIGAIDLIEVRKRSVVRDITVRVVDQAHGDRVVRALEQIAGVRVVNVSDRTFLLHLGGKIEVTPKVPVKTRDDLSLVYTPGVARVCQAIADDESKAMQLTIKRNTVAVITDGTAVLGLGDIGPKAAMPVMEGKAMLFKEFAGVDAFPLALDAKDPDEIVETIVRLAPAFGGINLEDISAPRCFYIEEELKKRLEIPVFHDDQHGTAVVVLAGLINAAKVVNKQLEDLTVVVSGVGAAGVAITKILLAAGVTNVIGCDRDGAISRTKRYDDRPIWQWYAEHTNPEGREGALADVIAGADVFIGVSRPNVLDVEGIQKMAKDPIVFAMANPDPEVNPEEAAPYVRVLATGRSDYPNQVNNVLAFPGIFRGALDCFASTVNEEMKLAAARAIAGIVAPNELNEDYIIPGVFNKRVVEAVAAAVLDAAYETGVARRERRASY